MMAGLHTRQAPDVRLLAREAKATGMPMMRPPFMRVNGRSVDFEDVKLSSSHATRRIRWEVPRR